MIGRDRPDRVVRAGLVFSSSQQPVEDVWVGVVLLFGTDNVTTAVGTLSVRVVVVDLPVVVCGGRRGRGRWSRRGHGGYGRWRRGGGSRCGGRGRGGGRR